MCKEPTSYNSKSHDITLWGSTKLGSSEATGPVSGTAKFERGIQSSLVSSEKGKACTN
jgi:hypothetical protein